MISIITVNWNSYDWFQIMLESLDIKSEGVPYTVILVDNSTVPEIIEENNVIQEINKENIGHGAGLNLGVEIEKEKVGNPYIFFLDIDCHAINQWQTPFIKLMNEYSVVGGKGVPEKPLRPACLFMKSEVAQKYDWMDTPGYKGHRVTPEGFDVAIQAYHKMIEDKVRIKLIESHQNHYGTLNGENWYIDDTPLIYHHWHGSHLKERQVDFKENLIDDKQLLFSKIPWRII